LREIARVLKPGGRAALVLRTSENKATAAFPSEVYRFWSRTELERAMSGAGMSTKCNFGDDEKHHPVLALAEKD
jgi:ubiquinone/menaquinone biosynthesis C-methylase UbiE